MKKWKCSVCGYIHEGEEPPEECPICGADRSQFVELVAEEAKAPEIPEPVKAAPATESVSPPKVEEVSSPKEQSPKPASGPLDWLEKYKTYTDLMAQLHAHPIAVHIPNGVLPVAVLFFFLSLIFQHSGLGTASFYNLVFVVLSMPLVIFTGVVDWKTQFRGAMTQVFKVKIVCAATVSILGLILVLWRFLNPGVMTPGPDFSWLFTLLLIIMLAAAATAGYYGGKLVFRKK